jgi:hypothetical protein
VTGEIIASPVKQETQMIYWAAMAGFLGAGLISGSQWAMDSIIDMVVGPGSGGGGGW